MGVFHIRDPGGDLGLISYPSSTCTLSVASSRLAGSKRVQVLALLHQQISKSELAPPSLSVHHLCTVFDGMSCNRLSSDYPSSCLASPKLVQ